MAEMQEQAIIQQQAVAIELLQERLATLEQAIPVFGNGWELMSGASGADFARDKLQDIADFSKIYFLKNPLIKRAVTVQSLYVFGQSYSVTAEEPKVQDILDAFWMNRLNQPVLSHQALMQQEQELQLNGNLFYVFFSGDDGVTVRTIPFSQVREIITNPEDAQEPWFYRRTYSVKELNGTSKQVDVYHPDWQYEGEKLPSIQGRSILWDAPVHHVRVNCLTDMQWGVPEVYAAIDWANAYKTFMEDWSKLVKAYSRFAWNATVKGGQNAVDAAKTALQDVLNADAAPGIFVGNQNTSLQPFRPGGATTNIDDSRRLLLMVGSATGIPEHILATDPSTSNLATSKSLERPVELQFSNRQRLWSDILHSICMYVVKQEGLSEDTKISVTFPDIVEHDINAQITALIDAATLKGQSLAGTIDLKTITRLLLRVLKVDDADDILTKLFPTDEIIMQRAGTPAVEEEGQEQKPKPGDDDKEQFEELDREISKTLSRMQEALDAVDTVS
jgi:hypothetical protein